MLLEPRQQIENLLAKYQSLSCAEMSAQPPANVYMLLVIALFIARMSGYTENGRWVGLASTLAIIPVAYLFVAGLQPALNDRPLILLVQLISA